MSGKENNPLLALLLFLASGLAFLPALKNGFVWDDQILIVLNPGYRGWALSNLRWMFTAMHAGPYQPLAWLSYSVDYLVGGMNPLSYHLTNILLHACNAVLFYFVAKRLLAAAFVALKDQAALNYSAFFAALFFSLHPLRVESVAWISERRDVLCGLFYLLTTLFYLRMADETGARRRRWHTAAVAAFALSLLSKATAMTLPVALLILDFYPLRRQDLGRRRLLIEKTPFLVLSLAAGAVAYVGQLKAGAMVDHQDYGLLARLGQAAFGLMFYLRKLLIPLELSPLYEMPANIHPLTVPFMLSAACALALSAVLFKARRAWPAGLAAWVYYVVTLAPVSGLVPYGMHLVADRYSYLSCMGWPILAGAGLLSLWQNDAARRRTLPLAVSVLTVLACLGALSWRQTKIWKDETSLWERAVALDPQASVTRNKLGGAFLKESRHEEALAQFQESARLNPDYANAHYNLGNAYSKKGDLEKAAWHLQRSIALKPRYYPAHVNRGLVLSRQGRQAEAIAHYREALKLNPRDAEAHNNLGAALAFGGKITEAIAHLRSAVEINPGALEARCNLAVLLAAGGGQEEAAAHLREALRLNPGHARSLKELVKLQSRAKTKGSSARPALVP